jgi:hypothetical protein
MSELGGMPSPLRDVPKGQESVLRHCMRLMRMICLVSEMKTETSKVEVQL